jgi:hypothetical protein
LKQLNKYRCALFVLVLVGNSSCTDSRTGMRRTADAAELEDASSPPDLEDTDLGPADAGEADAEVGDAGDAATDASVDAQPKLSCVTDSECGSEERYCYKYRDWDCGDSELPCYRYNPTSTCAGECRTKSLEGPCRHGSCPTSHFCPIDIHGEQGRCSERLGVGVTCLDSWQCQVGLACDPATKLCTAAPALGRPCTGDFACWGESWCVGGTCRAQSLRGEPCTRGSCGPADHCADPDQYGPEPGVCTEQGAASCITTGCAATQYCDDPDATGPLPGQCLARIADGANCRFDAPWECASGRCDGTGACVPGIADGGPCRSPEGITARCAPGLDCGEDDTCHPPLRLPAGASCRSASQCDSEWCKQGVCTADICVRKE